MVTREQLDAALDTALAALRVHDADPARVEKTRARCLSALARRGDRVESRGRAARRWRTRLEVCMAAGLAALYLAGTVQRVLELLR
jgi:hypothetical protein